MGCEQVGAQRTYVMRGSEASARSTVQLVCRATRRRATGSGDQHDFQIHLFECFDLSSAHIHKPR